MWELRQYRTVFTEFYAQCDEDMRAAIDQRLDRLRSEGNRAGMPLSRYLKGSDGILECRPRAGKRQARLLYFFRPQRQIVIVVAVFKDQKKLSPDVINRAEKIKRSIEAEQEIAHGIDHTH